MAVMYFAKLNINSDIYKVYEDDDLRDTILRELKESIGTEQEIRVPDPKDEDVEIVYKFISITKKDNIISGRLVKIYDEELFFYDDEEDDLESQPVEGISAFVTFVFDVEREQIGFVCHQHFRRKDFLIYFKELIELSVGKYEFELYLETNVGQLKSKFKNFDFIRRVEITLIPPNGDKEDYEALFDTNAAQLKETGAKKYTQIIQGGNKRAGDSLNVETDYINKHMYGLAKGYGNMVVNGYDKVGQPLEVNSDKDSPVKRHIPEIAKKSIPYIVEEGLKYIEEIQAMKRSLRISDFFKRAKDN